MLKSNFSVCSLTFLESGNTTTLEVGKVFIIQEVRYQKKHVVCL